MQHRHGQDHRQKEPVGHVDVGFLAFQQRAHEGDQQTNPDHSDQDVDIPDRLGIFLGLRGTKNITGCRQNDHQLPAPEHEPAKAAAEQPRRAGALDDIERRHDQRVAAKGKDHRAGVQRAQAAKVAEALQELEVQPRKGKLAGDDDADQKAHNAPKGRGDGPGPDYRVEIFMLHIGLWIARRPQHPKKSDARCKHHRKRIDLIGQVTGVIGRNRGQDRDEAKPCQFQVVPHFASLRPVRPTGPICRLGAKPDSPTVRLLRCSGLKCLDLGQQVQSRELILVNARVS